MHLHTDSSRNAIPEILLIHKTTKLSLQLLQYHTNSRFVLFYLNTFLCCLRNAWPINKLTHDPTLPHFLYHHHHLNALRFPAPAKVLKTSGFDCSSHYYSFINANWHWNDRTVPAPAHTPAFSFH